MRRKNKQRKANIAHIMNYMFKRTQMRYTLIYHAEDIAEESLCDDITLDGITIYSTKNKPVYIHNRRILLRYTRRITELKPYKLYWRGSRSILK